MNLIKFDCIIYIFTLTAVSLQMEVISMHDTVPEYLISEIVYW